MIRANFTLVAFGGGGPLHACSLARSPAHSNGVRSRHAGSAFRSRHFAGGCGSRSCAHGHAAGRCRSSSSSLFSPNSKQKARAEFAAEGLTGVRIFARSSLRGPGIRIECSVGSRCLLRIRSRNFIDRTGSATAFAILKSRLQIVNLRLRMTAAAEPYAPVRASLCPATAARRVMLSADLFRRRVLLSRLYHREQLRPGDAIDGPAMITEYTSATMLPPGSRASVDAFENLVIAVGEDA